MGVLEAALWGLLGGTLPEILKVYRLRHKAKEKRPEWLSSVFYWVITIVMVFLGAGLAALYQQQGAAINPWMAIHLGATAPITLTAVIQEQPKDK